MEKLKRKPLTIDAASYKGVIIHAVLDYTRGMLRVLQRALRLQIKLTICGANGLAQPQYIKV